MTTLQERLIDPSLKIQPFKRGRDTAKDLGRKTGNLVHSTLNAVSENHRQHKNYLEYLTDCYNHHYGIVVKPDMIWFTILNEVATHIKVNADRYQHLFTRSKEGKIEIIVLSDSLTVMPVEKLIERLRVHVPVDVDQFLPEFSTTTDIGRIAHFAAFCDAMSPYYSYGMMMCGISAIRVDGTTEDWQKIIDGIKHLRDVLDGLDKYLVRAAEIVKQIIDGSEAFWEGIIHVERCGSGGETEVTGWFTELTPMKDKRAPLYTENYPSHVAKFDYRQMDTGKEYSMMCGIFESQIEDKWLVPSYGRLIYEKVEQKKKDPNDPIEIVITKRRFDPPGPDKIDGGPKRVVVLDKGFFYAPYSVDTHPADERLVTDEMVFTDGDAEKNLTDVMSKQILDELKNE